MSQSAPIVRLHLDVSAAADDLSVRNASRLKCRRGCSSCCVDELSVFAIEADRIRSCFSELLAIGEPHAVGACAFLDDEGACRIYEERPYVCRTQGLPLRWLEVRDGVTVELRDICPLNDDDPALEPLAAIAAEDCWTLGKTEERLAQLQIASSPSAPRQTLRALFAKNPNRSKVPA